MHFVKIRIIFPAKGSGDKTQGSYFLNSSVYHLTIYSYYTDNYIFFYHKAFFCFLVKIQFRFLTENINGRLFKRDQVSGSSQFRRIRGLKLGYKGLVITTPETPQQKLNRIITTN